MRELKKLSKYTNGIYNNCYYKFINSSIDIFDKKTNKINRIGNNYNLICFYNGKYYTTKFNDNKNIYILNTSYDEIDKIVLMDFNNNIISLALFANNIYILLQDNILKFDMQGNYLGEELKNFTNIYEEKKVELKNLSKCPILQKRKVVKLTALGVYKNQLIVAFQKRNSAYIGILKNKEIEKVEFIYDNSKIISIMDVNNILEFLITKYDSYTYLLYKKCRNQSCFKRPCENKPCDDDCDKSGIIDSIASIEYSIATLIKAESSKINDSLNKAKNIEELVQINDSATKLIKNITLLESVLVEKLEAIINVK